MGQSSLDDVADLTDRMYEAVYDDSQWGGVMGEVKSRLGASSGAFGFLDTRSVAMQMLFAECQPGFEEQFCDTTLNPFLPRIFSAPAGDAFIDQSVMLRAELEKTTFFNEWLRPQGEQSLLSVKVLAQGNITAHLTMFRARGQSPFDEHDVGFARQIMPTLMRVAHLRTRVGALQLTQKADACEALKIGFLVVDQEGRLLLCNAVGEQFLADPQFGLDALMGHLSARSMPERGLLRRAIADACSDVDGIQGQGGDVLVSDPATGLPAASLSVAPLRDASLFGLPAARAAVIFIQDLAAHLPPRFEERTRALFGLTRKEAGLAAALASGKTLREAADERFISMPTARTQLAHIFGKTHTSQQSQLVSLLLGILPVRDD